LAKRIGWDLAKLEELASSASYRLFTLKGTTREVQEPPAALQALHRQLHKYLGRVETPNYLHSAIKGRSYITNASTHVGAERMIKIDVKRFFPSVPQHKVMHFFRDTMKCAPDVAGLLANLICWNGKLATGSSVSPIISYYAFKALFDEIELIASRNGLMMSCYVDDLTLSGPAASRKILHEVRTAILRAGLGAHKAKYFEGAQPKLVTGVMVGLSGLHLPFSRWQAIRADEKQAAGSADIGEKIKVLNRLVSRLYEAAQLDQRCRHLAERHHETLRALKQQSQAAA
jgi:hypothetical protein